MLETFPFFPDESENEYPEFLFNGIYEDYDAEIFSIPKPEQPSPSPEQPSPSPEPTDTSEKEPETCRFMFDEQSNGVFRDIQECHEILKGLQQKPTKHLKGYILLKANKIGQFRYGKSNHNKDTPVIYLNQVDPSIAQYLE